MAFNLTFTIDPDGTLGVEGDETNFMFRRVIQFLDEGRAVTLHVTDICDGAVELSEWPKKETGDGSQ